MTRATESAPLVVSADPFLRPGAQRPSLPFAPQSSLALPLPPPAAVTTTDPPSCNPTLSAFLFLFQQVRTGCPSRGYGGRRVQRTVPLPPNTLPESQTSAISRGVRREVSQPRRGFLLFRPRFLAREPQSRELFYLRRVEASAGCCSDGVAELSFGTCGADVGHVAGCQLWTCSQQNRARLRSSNAWTELGRSQA